MKKKEPVTSVYQLKITLDAVRPPVWRRVLTPSNIKLPELHNIILRAMGWDGYHLHAFQVGGVSYGELSPDYDDGYMEDERRVRLNEIAPAEKSKFRYEYDFGDSWLHTIVVEKILPPVEGQPLPVCITGKRACPPEDCGGPWGYVEFLEAIADPDNERHEELLEWVGGEFDPEEFDLEAINEALKSLPR